ncbi:DUF4294 domain-containing protein [Robertkochia flava]|uniref:DUF4294 domain-containing protein n=1 Tax=Robertkochia flava TaxID=3447986 RepID=UPI001CCC8BE0|nr:DUF4294 domain-containing protein [Robertkochia marina]
MYAQVKKADSLKIPGQRDSVPVQYFFFEGDSIPRTAIELDPVFVFQPLVFDNYEAKRHYYILKRKTLKVYPYAKLAAERLTELNERLGRMETNADRNRYTRIIQKYIEEEFSAELKKLTRTEGQILVKLIYRQTGNTAFDLVRNLRSGWRAFWYNTTASMFDISLKETYEPSVVHEDYLIEDILQRAFASEQLEPQASVLDFDYGELTNKWSINKLDPN